MQYQKVILNQQADETGLLLLNLADEMAAAATTFSGQGYGSFLQAREEFKTVLFKTLLDAKNI